MDNSLKENEVNVLGDTAIAEAKETKTHSIAVRVDDDLYQYLKKEAIKHGSKIATEARRILMGDMRQSECIDEKR